MDTLLISLRIAGRNVSLNVPPKERELVERAAQLLNAKIDSMSGSSVDAEMRLLLSALSVCGDYMRLKDEEQTAAATEPASGDADFADKLEALSLQLEAALNNETPTP